MAITGLGEIAEKVRRSTVLLHAGRRGSGSGVIWSSDGLIITNAHVARSSPPCVQLWDGREFEATITARDPHRDLALLHVNASGLAAATAADSARLCPGELVVAVGNPLGFVGALTTGVLHAVGPIRGFGSQSWVQAGVRLAPGNSGGPLADAHGRVIGINTMVAGRMGLAIPSNDVRKFLSVGPSHAWLGVTLRPVLVRRRNGNAFGLVVLEVEPTSPAAQASLLPGDILIGTEEATFHSLEDCSSAIEADGPRLVRLEFLRGDYARVRRVTVQLGASRVPRSAAAA